MPYYPKAKYSKPKSAQREEFIVKRTQEYYKGTYVKTSDNKYFSGKSPMDTEEELQKVTSDVEEAGVDIGLLFGILAGSLGGFFIKKLTQNEKQKGVAKRYFVQDKNNKKIVETDKATYLQTQKQVTNRSFAEADWIIKGPAEDMMFGNYPYEGAESKNKKTIQALEKTMPGISTFITDYKYLVEDPAATQKPQLTSETFIQPDPNIKLEDDRKANFDTRKSRRAAPPGFHYMPDGTLMSDSEMVNNPSMKNSQMSNNSNITNTSSNMTLLILILVITAVLLQVIKLKKFFKNKFSSYKEF